jgi:hypothetical protein
MKKVVLALGIVALTGATVFAQGLAAQWGFVVTVVSGSGKHVRSFDQVITQYQGVPFASQNDCESARQDVAAYGIQTSQSCMEFYSAPLP